MAVLPRCRVVEIAIGPASGSVAHRRDPGLEGELERVFRGGGRWRAGVASLAARPRGIAGLPVARVAYARDAAAA